MRWPAVLRVCMATVSPSSSSAPESSFGSDASSPKGERRRRPSPAGTQPYRVLWPYTISIAVVHLLALLAFVPWFFSWTGLVLCIAGHYVFGMLGVTLGYHRLLTHRGFKCPRWLEYSLATL